MWGTINFILLFTEVLIIVYYVHNLSKKKVNHSFVLLSVFLVNFALHFTPYLYSVIELNAEDINIYNVFECLSGAVRNFVGEVTTPIVVDYGKVFPTFSVVYTVGTLLAMGTAISTLLSIFNSTIINKAKLFRILHSKSCNILIGDEQFYCRFAHQNKNTVIMLSPDFGADETKNMVENGYVVLPKKFSAKFLKSNFLNKKTKYNIICACDYEEFIEYLDEFVLFKESNQKSTNIYLYVEIEERKMELTIEELIVNSGYAEYISLFNCSDLVARTLVDNNSLAKYLPRDFLSADTSLKDNADLHVYIFGYSDLSKKIYKYLLLNNHFVTYNNGYHPYPVKYHIYDENADENEWNINGMKSALNSFDTDEYLPIPELTYETDCIKYIPHSQQELNELKDAIIQKNTYNYIVIDLENVYDSLEYAMQLKKLLNGSENYKIFVKAKSSLLKKHPDIISFGDVDNVLTEDIIVNESILQIAKAINGCYVKQHQSNTEAERPEKESDILSKLWKKLNYYTMQSNICAAMGLRVKLNLLSLDYLAGGEAKSCELISKKYPYESYSSTFDCYSQQSLQNAIRAQEHSRWVMFHLLSKWMPMKKEDIKAEVHGQSLPVFKTKNVNEKKHICITTQDGLAKLSLDFSEKASQMLGVIVEPQQYEFFKNDDMVLINSSEILHKNGFSVIHLQNEFSRE